MAKKSKTKPDKEDEQDGSNDGQSIDLKIRINEFGEIIKDRDINDIISFLNDRVKDKKIDNIDEMP